MKGRRPGWKGGREGAAAVAAIVFILNSFSFLTATRSSSLLKVESCITTTTTVHQLVFIIAFLFTHTN